MSNCIHLKEWDEITYPLSNFNSEAIDVQEWRSNFIFILLHIWLTIYAEIDINPYDLLGWYQEYISYWIYMNVTMYLSFLNRKKNQVIERFYVNICIKPQTDFFRYDMNVFLAF